MLAPIFRCLLASLTVAIFLSGTHAYAAPPPSQETPEPKSLMDGAFAAHVWNMKPKAKETTSALHARARTEIRKLMANGDPDQLKKNAEHWRLLTYLHDYPWKKLPTRWQAWYLQEMPNPRLTDEQSSSALTKLEKTPIYKMEPKELDLYLGNLCKTQPSLRERVVHIARKNLGQPYDMYLLGEFPYEIHDDQPLFDLNHGDCVVFSEHTYAMALSCNWTAFFANLQKLRYKNGEIGLVTRNHFTEADWIVNNRWLLTDMTTKLDATTVTHYTEKIDRSAFFAKFGIGQGIPVQTLEDEYIPADAIASVAGKLKDGDFVNIVRGVGDGGVWVGHVGLIAHGKDGEVHFIHSTSPKSVEVPLLKYVNDNIKKNVERRRKGDAEFKGMKFLTLNEDVLKSGQIPASSH